MTNHIAHFEIFANDVERARKFYEKVFAWRFEVGGPPDFSDWTDATRTESRKPVSNGPSGAEPNIDATASRSGEGSSARPLSQTSGTA